MTLLQDQIADGCPSPSGITGKLFSPNERSGLFWIMLFLAIGNLSAHAAVQNPGKISTGAAKNSGIEHIHIVKPGESLSTIVKSYFGDNDQLKIIARFNHIENINQIRIGQEIKIPVIQSTQTDPLQENEFKGAKPSTTPRTGRINETGLKNEKPLSRTESFRKMNRILFVFIIIALLAALIYLLKKFAAQQDAPVSQSRRENEYFVKLVKETESPERNESFQ